MLSFGNSCLHLQSVDCAEGMHCIAETILSITGSNTPRVSCVSWGTWLLRRSSDKWDMPLERKYEGHT